MLLLFKVRWCDREKRSRGSPLLGPDVDAVWLVVGDTPHRASRPAHVLTYDVRVFCARPTYAQPSHDIPAASSHHRSDGRARRHGRLSVCWQKRESSAPVQRSSFVDLQISLSFPFALFAEMLARPGNATRITNQIPSLDAPLTPRQCPKIQDSIANDHGHTQTMASRN